MLTDTHQKVRSTHLKRNAFLYVRQSTLRQVLENAESTKRQYALRERALTLGWHSDQVVVIDTDLGQSGASATDREGFQRLVSEVGMGRAGVVMGLEVSRLARNSTDWHRLLEICALTDTLILDEDGVYDPSTFNDRLLLGLKGTMSEAELHLLRARLQGGLLNKARRGELQCALPMGFLYDVNGHVILDPDTQVQGAIRHLFLTFRRTGSTTATVRSFHSDGILFPSRVRHGPNRDQVHWGDLVHSRALQILHNPRYAGVFFWGRTRQRKRPDGGVLSVHLNRDEWIALLPDAHAAYISWSQFEENQQRLKENSTSYRSDPRRSPPREGPALLQGLVLCGKCGLRMTVRYHARDTGLLPEYLCQRKRVDYGARLCQSVHGGAVDKAIGDLLVGTLTPVALDLALDVHAEIQSRIDEVDRARHKQVERARYEADLARRRYMRVDPDNRLVADSLEAEWNAKLRALSEAQDLYEQQREVDRTSSIDAAQRERVLALATDFPRLWSDPATPYRERKRMVRLLLEDVTLLRGENISLHARFRGGATKSLTIPTPPRAWKKRMTNREVVIAIDRLLDQHTEREIAALLNERGFRSGGGDNFESRTVQRIRRQYHLPSRHARLRAAGLLTQGEIAAQLGISPQTARIWAKRGLLQSYAYDDKHGCLYQPLGAVRPVKHARGNRTPRAPKYVRVSRSDRTDEVQYES